MLKNLIIALLGISLTFLVINYFRQKSELETQHQIIKDLSIDLKNCEAREEVLIDITGKSII